MFHLRKYYLDCVTADGAAAIVYSARLHWGKLGVSYAAVLRRDRDGSIHQAASVAPQREPAIAAGALVWRHSRLEVDARLHPELPARSRVLLDGVPPAVEWDCIAPRATAAIRIGGAAAFRGHGYAECLTMRIEPWKLPFRTLRWGRFLADDACVIWNDWSDGCSRTLVSADGVDLPGACVGDDVLLLGDGRVLEIADRCVLRDGPIVDAIAGVSPLVRRLPPCFLHSHETKWLSRGVLRARHRDPIHGWAIHEKVTLR